MQDHSADLLGSIVFAVNVLLIAGAHLALDGTDGPIRIGDGLPLGYLAHHSLVILKGHDGRGGSGTLRIRNDDRLAALQNRHAGICST
ncbi:hypothetical protein SDC9_158969 [bioreactor metagenome]|uniref:Uncharacterized protein n=1 Tax=bioreactor metagenome TaxID=1076179 RepID=A0A645FBC0_9ZZZZ